MEISFLFILNLLIFLFSLYYYYYYYCWFLFSSLSSIIQLVFKKHKQKQKSSPKHYKQKKVLEFPFRLIIENWHLSFFPGLFFLSQWLVVVVTDNVHIIIENQVLLLLLLISSHSSRYFLAIYNHIKRNKKNTLPSLGSNSCWPCKNVNRSRMMAASAQVAGIFFFLFFFRWKLLKRVYLFNNKTLLSLNNNNNNNIYTFEISSLAKRCIYKQNSKRIPFFLFFFLHSKHAHSIPNTNRHWKTLKRAHFLINFSM